jgi:transcription-repair coupling factor (superfamily II helicase)
MLQEAVLAARSSGAADNQAAYPEVRIDLAVPFILPEEYVSAADERVLFYRRLAAATDEETVTRIEEQLLHTYGALPAPAQNLVDRARAKVLAAELGVTTITVQRGKFNLEPLELTQEQTAAMKSRGGIYMVKSKKLMVPPQQGVGLLAALLELLGSLLTLLAPSS